jgi:hypothetical protein
VIEIDRKVRYAALGAWLDALLYTRAKELDGWCPLSHLDALPSEHVLNELIRVGLASREEKDGFHGIRLHRYEEHNDTKAEIDERKATDRKRKGSKESGGKLTDSDRNPNGSQRKVSSDVAGIPVSVSLSDLSSGSPKPEIHPARLSLVPPEAPIALTDPMPDELREAAQILGVRDPGGAWVKFTGANNGRLPSTLKGGLSGAWQVWCGNEAQFERRERDRRPPARTMVQPAAPGQSWAHGDGMKWIDGEWKKTGE